MLTKCVFDLECVGVAWDHLDEKTQHDLLRHIKTDEEREAEKERLALYPVTGIIVTIALLNPDTKKARVLYLTKEQESVWHQEDASFVPFREEKELLEAFWKDIAAYDQIISFNGRGFDAPYILFRSMVHAVTPTCDLMPNRYGDYRKGYNAHLDLADQLSHYGAARRFSLHVYTTALGITSPKEEGVDGLAVPRLFEEGHYKTIAQYCLRDVIATAELYRRWKSYGGYGEV